MARAPVVVVGAGFGGLATAVSLARAGERVVVLEREARPGGKARAIEVGGESIDVGPTVLTMRWVFDELFREAGRSLEEAVELEEARLVARHAFPGGSRLDLFPQIDASADAIGAFAGAREAAAYRRFAAHAQAIAETVREPFMTASRPTLGELFARASRVGLGALSRIDAHRTMARALASTFEDPRLRQLFGRYATYVGSSPYEAPATYNLVSHVEREGVSVVAGGMSTLAAAVADLAASLGVELHFGARVREIVATGGRVTGVAVELAGGERELLAARAVVANADVSTLASGALGPAAAASVDAVPRAKRSLSALTWAIAGRASGFPLAHHSVFFSRDYEAEMRQLFSERRLPDDPTVYVCASDRPTDGSAAAPGDERLFVIVNAPADADHRPLEPEAIHRCERAMIARLADAGLELTPRAMVRMTPSLYERLAPGTGGAIYGAAAHGAFAPLARPGARTSLRGLYLASGSAHPGPGVPMAALGGRIAAAAVLEDLASERASVGLGQRKEPRERPLGEAAPRALAAHHHRREA